MNTEGRKVNGGHTAGLKSLHIKLPADHPIFKLPRGERSSKAREWMDRGMDLAVFLSEIRQEITVLQENLKNCQQTPATTPELPVKRNTGKQNINPDVFLDI